MKEKIKNFFTDNGRIVIILIFILELLLAFFITPNKYDDAKFLGFLESYNSITDILIDRYQNWTSRIILDFSVLSILKTSKYIWVLIQAGMMALLAYSISKLFVKKEDRNQTNFFVGLLILIYPLDLMAGAGWGATTINYLWPLATMLFAFIPIRKIWDGEKIKWFEYILYSLALLYAGNQEQSCAILVGVYIVFLVFLTLKNKKANPYIIIQTILAIASIVFILTTPGNYVRQESEINSIFPNFNMLSVQDKLSLGFTSTLGIIISDTTIPFGIMSFMIAVYVFTTYKEKIYKIVASIPLVTICALTFFKGKLFEIFPYLSSLRGALTSQDIILKPSNADNLFYAIPIVFSIIVFASVVLSLLLIFKNLKNNKAAFVFLVGLCSRLIMGFSPTVFASSSRTMIFFDFAMLIVTLLIWQEFSLKDSKNDKKYQQRIKYFFIVIAILQYINSFLAILLTQQ